MSPRYTVTVHCRALPNSKERLLLRERDGIYVKTIVTKTAGRTVLAMALILMAKSLSAQEARRTISSPVPVYPDVAKRIHLVGVVKMTVVVAPDGHIKETRVIGGHSVPVKSRRGKLTD